MQAFHSSGAAHRNPQLEMHAAVARIAEKLFT
jgi:hypothetical protein